MEYFPAPLEALVEQFARLPGIGGKTAQRLAFHVLSLPEEDAQAFADAIVTAKRTVTYCPVCRNFTAGGLCPICSSPKRDNSVICVVADPRDVAAMERGREFNGKYHVLHGVISPMNHVGPDDIAIKPLLERVAQGGVQEVIMATNPDTEGDKGGMEAECSVCEYKETKEIDGDWTKDTALVTVKNGRATRMIVKPGDKIRLYPEERTGQKAIGWKVAGQQHGGMAVYSRAAG